MGIALDMCLAVSYLHHNGVIHGDIKAANVMLTDEPLLDDGRVYCAKLADFGQSLVLHGAGGSVRRQLSDGLGTALQSSGTAPAGWMSSPSPYSGGQTELPPNKCEGVTSTHAAPEVLQIGTFSLASDIYSLGVLLWELSSGLRPYKQ